MNEEETAELEDEVIAGKGLAVAALVLGIMAFFPGCCASGFYGQYILAILAIIFGAMSMNGPAAGIAKAGLTLGIVAIVLWIVLTIVGVEAGDRFMEWAQQQQQQQTEGAGNGGFNNEGDAFNENGGGEPAGG